MEIAMYYTLQKLEGHIQSLESRGTDENKNLPFEIQDTAANEMIRSKEQELKHKLHIK
jgi:hypothetical protein